MRRQGSNEGKWSERVTNVEEGKQMEGGDDRMERESVILNGGVDRMERRGTIVREAERGGSRR